MFSYQEDKRIAIVDCFRFACILAVAVFHYTVRWQPPMSPVNIPGFQETFPHFLSLGALGVQVFFVISGLVIAMTLHRSRGVTDFALKRFARLYGTFAACATITYVVTKASDVAAFQVSFADYLKNICLYNLFVPGKVSWTAPTGVSPSKFSFMS